MHSNINSQTNKKICQALGSLSLTAVIVTKEVLSSNCNRSNFVTFFKFKYPLSIFICLFVFKAGPTERGRSTPSVSFDPLPSQILRANVWTLERNYLPFIIPSRTFSSRVKPFPRVTVSRVQTCDGRLLCMSAPPRSV